MTTVDVPARRTELRHAGATNEQVHETIGVALLMGGGPASTYATNTLRALDQFEA